ncbi:MAG: hypothetical protein ACM338_00320 [Betaproteobacteria bacterium]
MAARAERESVAARRDTVAQRLVVRRESATVRRASAAGSDTRHAEPTADGDAVAASPAASREQKIAAPDDRWQALNEALANCGGNFIERIVCGQRARFRYCDGYWGRVPQCPSGAVADNR